MHILFEPAHADRVSPTRLVMLPAAYTSPNDFVREGFVNAARERLAKLDLVFVELRIQHLTDRTILRRLRHEVVLPARAAGVRTIWLAGVSLGGYVAAAYAERYTQEVDGVCLFAPYLGNHIMTGEIERANGLETWQPGEIAEDDDDRRIWRFIQTHRSRTQPLLLGYGRDDRFADSHQLVARALPPESVDIVAGGHDWGAWRTLWGNFLDARFV